MYKVQVTPIIGLPQFDGWAHVATTNQGAVVWVLAISGNHAGNVGRDLVDFLETQTAQSPQEIYRLVQRIIQDTREKLCELSCTVVILGEATSMFCAYRGQIWLRRNGKLGKLLIADSNLGVVEGKVADHDVYIIATQQATRFLDEVEQKIIQGYDTDTIVTSITPGMRLEENTAQSALAFISPEANRDATPTSPPVSTSPSPMVQAEAPVQEQTQAQIPEQEVEPTIQTQAEKTENLHKSLLKKILAPEEPLLKNLIHHLLQSLKLGRFGLRGGSCLRGSDCGRRG